MAASGIDGRRRLLLPSVPSEAALPRVVQLRELAAYDTPGDAHSLALAGSYVYVADGNEGLVVLRVQ